MKMIRHEYVRSNPRAVIWSRSCECFESAVNRFISQEVLPLCRARGDEIHGEVLINDVQTLQAFAHEHYCSGSLRLSILLCSGALRAPIFCSGALRTRSSDALGGRRPPLQWETPARLKYSNLKYSSFRYNSLRYSSLRYNNLRSNSADSLYSLFSRRCDQSLSAHCYR